MPSVQQAVHQVVVEPASLAAAHLASNVSVFDVVAHLVQSEIAARLLAQHHVQLIHVVPLVELHRVE